MISAQSGFQDLLRRQCLQDREAFSLPVTPTGGQHSLMVSFSDICPVKDKKKEVGEGGRKEAAWAIQPLPTQKLLFLFVHNTLQVGAWPGTVGPRQQFSLAHNE